VCSKRREGFVEVTMNLRFSAATLVLVAAMLLGGPMRQGADAQVNQPIYPAYDGYLRNPDGSYTFSHFVVAASSGGLHITKITKHTKKHEAV
jgi:hypothetical protein